MTTHHHIHDFSKLAGVSVKALHHYDRLGVLEPARTDAGYRVYTARDLERLEQIVALKFLGFPLKTDDTSWIAPLSIGRTPFACSARRSRPSTPGWDVPSAQSEQRRPPLAVGQQVSAGLLKQIIAEIDMQDSVEMMRTYYSGDAWERRRQRDEQGPLPEWRALYQDVAALLGTDPASREVQALADRWLALSVKSAAGAPEAQTDSMTAWMDREHLAAAHEAARCRVQVGRSRGVCQTSHDRGPEEILQR